MANILDKIMHNGNEYDFPEGIPSGGTDGQFLGKVSGDTAWTDAPEETVVSGDSGTTYTIKVANSDPASGTPATTITFVL